jgi:hypothetical protein
MVSQEYQWMDKSLEIDNSLQSLSLLRWADAAGFAELSKTFPLLPAHVDLYEKANPLNITEV